MAYGFAANQKLFNHYVDDYGATPICMLHEFHFIMENQNALSLLEEYTYEWTDEEI